MFRKTFYVAYVVYEMTFNLKAFCQVDFHSFVGLCSFHTLAGDIYYVEYLLEPTSIFHLFCEIWFDCHRSKNDVLALTPEFQKPASTAWERYEPTLMFV